MHVTYGTTDLHAQKLKRGLAALGPDFCAILCWWCEGTTMRKHEHCTVCGEGKFYGSALGLLTPGNSKPASESVVNQVLVAAERDVEAQGWRPCEACTDPMDCGSWATCHSPQKDFLTTLAGGGPKGS